MTEMRRKAEIRLLPDRESHADPDICGENHHPLNQDIRWRGSGLWSLTVGMTIGSMGS